ncbi:MAG: OmpA family protein [Ignavibacteriae bacterium]|nr:OmpA family protein [Ignavibacteriota bacterium]
MAIRFNRKLTEEEEAKVSKDRYLITYADLITLLLGLFVILYAASQVDEERYKELSKAFKDYFKSTKEQVLQGSGGVFNGHKDAIPEPIMPNPGPKSLEEVTKQAEESLGMYLQKGLISIRSSQNELVLALPEQLLFKSGKADVEPQGVPVLDSIANIIKNVDFQITVDGHTDDVPIRTFRYESNWHLSVARAMNVAYKLITRGIRQENLIVRGYGEQMPVADNLTEEGRTKNRRVEVTVSNLPTKTLSKEGYLVNENKPK